jgi:hypothetical protein
VDPGFQNRPCLRLFLDDGGPQWTHLEPTFNSLVLGSSPSRVTRLGFRGFRSLNPQPLTRHAQGKVLDDRAGWPRIVCSPPRLRAPASSGRRCGGGVWSCPAVAAGCALPAPLSQRAVMASAAVGSAATGRHANTGQARVGTSSKDHRCRHARSEPMFVSRGQTSDVRRQTTGVGGRSRAPNPEPQHLRPTDRRWGRGERAGDVPGWAGLDGRGDCRNH